MYRRDHDAYFDGAITPSTAVEAIGWLSKDVGFPEAISDPAWLDKLARMILREPVAPTAGYHRCPFCLDKPALAREGAPPLWLGSAETWVPSADGATVFAAPNLIHHYISKHHYKPPDAFIEAVRAFDLDSKWKGEEVLEREIAMGGYAD